MKAELLHYLTIHESEHSCEAWKYYASHVSYKSKSVDELAKIVFQKAKEACWYFTLASIKKTDRKKLGFASKPELFSSAIELFNEAAIASNWKFKLTSVDELAHRLRPFHKVLKNEITIDGAFESIISKKIGKRNAMKLGPEQQACLNQIFSQCGSKYKTTTRLYLNRANEMVKAGLWKREQSIVTLRYIKRYLKAQRI